MSHRGYMRHDRQYKIKTRRRPAGLLDVLESLIYELKPIGYLIFAIAVLKAPMAQTLMIKYSSLGILVFSVYLILNRLIHRGYL